MWWIIILGSIIYLIIGKVTANFFIENGIISFYDEDSAKMLIILFFPIVLLWRGINYVADKITEWL